jgi:hypothetical protein
MGLHPNIRMSRRKELNFFNFDTNFERGESWYRSWFRTDRPVRGEASPGYAAWPQFRDVPARMRAVVPDAKLIYLVRDPIERLVSHWLHNVLESKEARPLPDAVGSPDNPYVARSLYGVQLERYLEHWPLDRILIVRSDDLLDDRAATLARVFRFTGADPSFSDPRFGWLRHRTAIKRRRTALGQRIAATAPMRLLGRLPERLRWPIEDLLYLPFSTKIDRPGLDAALVDELRRRFRLDLERLGVLTGERFDEWLAPEDGANSRLRMY